VQSDNSVNFRIFHNAVVYHRRASNAVLFGRLENQLNRTLQAIPALHQHRRRAEKHGRVRVVPARVHPPVFRGEWKVRALIHAQGVHIGAYPQDLTRFFPLDQRDDSMPGDALLDFFDSHFLEFLHYESLGKGQVQPQFRIGVEIPPPLDYLAVHCFCAFFNIEHLS